MEGEFAIAQPRKAEPFGANARNCLEQAELVSGHEAFDFSPAAIESRCKRIEGAGDAAPDGVGQGHGNSERELAAA